jgi:DNA replication protein DnaC
MSITIKRNKGIKLNIPEFICDDNPIGEHLNKYDMLKHLNKYSFDVFIGKPGSGKTSLLVSFLSDRGKKKIYKKCFDNILIVMPRQSRNSLKNDIFKDHAEEKMYDQLDLTTISDILIKLQTYSLKKENTLLILDDVAASLKNRQIEKTLTEIIFNRRHLKCKIVMLIQTFKSVKLDIRKTIVNAFIYKPSKKEFETLFDELIEQDKDVAHTVMKIVFDRPHKYLMMNIETQKMYDGFDEIIINNEK